MKAIQRAQGDQREWQLRVDLAACFRLAVHFDWHESVGNHFSVAVSDDGKQFLMNPKWRHFSRIRASDLLLLDVDDQASLEGPNAPDPTAWCIHSHLHRSLPEAKVLLHCHPPYTTALATLKDPSLKAIDQNTARFHNRLIIDSEFGGMADNDEEGHRLAKLFSQCRSMIMGNHGVTTAAATVAEAFEDLYFLERASKTLMLAYASGQPLNILSDDVAEKTARAWEELAESAFDHFAQLKMMLDEQGADYAS